MSDDIYADLLNATVFTLYTGAKFKMNYPYSFNAFPPSGATAHYIIVSDEGTSEKPRKHPTLAEATKEAERLARMKPGFNFIVYKAVTSKNTSVTPINTLNFQ